MRTRILAGVALLLVAASARADENAVIADKLFSEGKRLMAEQKYAEACPKLAESQRLDPGGGTLLLLASCHERAGKLASAWSEYTMAAAGARRDGRADREQIANERAAALASQVPYLTIAVSERTAAVPGIQIRLDDTQVQSPVWNTPIPLDPGAHVVHADAPGMEPWNAPVTLDAGKSARVEVDGLVPQPAAPSPAATSPSPPADTANEGSSSDSGRRTAGFVVGGAGLLITAAGAYFGIHSLGLASDIKAKCDPAHCTDPSAADLYGSASTSATLADVLLPLGLVATGVGGWLVLTSHGSAPVAEARLVPTASPGGGGAALVGRW